MLLLTSTSDLVQVITGGTQAVKVHASWVDNASGTITPGRTNTAIASATTTTVVASPAASTQRNVKFLSIQNTDATTADTVTVQHTDGTTVVILFKMALPAGWAINFVDGAGWQVFDTNGNVQQSSIAGTGQLIKTSFLVSSQTFTTQTSTRTVSFEMVGGGGGGATVSNAAANGAGGGGGAGAYLKKSGVAVTGSTGYVFTAGAAGASGGAGGSSTIVIGATTYTAPGGTNGPAVTSVAGLTASLGGAGGAAPTNGDINATGAPGDIGVVDVSATTGVSGCGGSTLWGGGGNGIAASGNGVAAGGNGAGGGGGLSLTAGTRSGGVGTIGAILIYEYS